MADEPDYYAVLGVAPDSEDIVIQAAYRALMRRYHPDKNPSKDAQRKTVEINAAYAVIGDPTRRLAYDAGRAAEARDASSSKAESSTPPPPPPPPPRGNSSYGEKSPARASETGSRGGLIFAAILTVCLVGGLILSASNSNDVANNTMNVDENLTTTDMSATDMNATDMNASAIDLNAVDVNLAAAEPADLSKQAQTALSYDTIEAAATRVAKMITTKGISGARVYSENCHKAVQASPSWNGADDCAAFDYAAAYIDDAVSTQAGWPKNGYFEFQNTNEPDDYAAVGAPSYVTSDRLNKLRAAAQSAADEAFREQVARIKAREQSQATTPPQAATSNSSD